MVLTAGLCWEFAGVCPIAGRRCTAIDKLIALGAIALGLVGVECGNAMRLAAVCPAIAEFWRGMERAQQHPP